MSYIDMDSNLRFLVIDSEHSSASQFKIDLAKVGYRNVTIIADEMQALEHVKKQPVDFIFCRQNLVKMSGTEFLEELKNDYNIERKPFVTYMEKVSKEDVMLIIEAGADNHMTIPYNIKDLAERVTGSWAKYKDTNNPDVTYELGRRFFLQKKYKEANEAFLSLIAKKQLVAQSKIGQIRIRLDQQQNTEALQLANTLVAEFPKFVLSHHWLGLVQLNCKLQKEAIKSFSQAITMSPKNPVRYQKVSEILSNLEQWEAIVTLLKQAEGLQLNYNFVEEGLARALIKLGRKEEAIEYYRILVKRNPKVANYCNNIAVCFKALKNYNKAIQYLNQGLEVDPQNISILFNMALIWFDKGRTDKAIEKLEEVLRIDPTFDKAKIKLDQLKGGGQLRAAS